MDEDLFYFIFLWQGTITYFPFYLLPAFLSPCLSHSAPHLLFISSFVSSPKLSPNPSQLPLTTPHPPFLFVSFIYSLTYLLSFPYYLPLTCVFIFFIFSFSLSCFSICYNSLPFIPTFFFYFFPPLTYTFLVGWLVGCFWLVRFDLGWFFSSLI